jgi:hypothetical protein
MIDLIYNFSFKSLEISIHLRHHESFPFAFGIFYFVYIFVGTIIKALINLLLSKLYRVFI